MFIDNANIIRQKRKTIKLIIDNNGVINIFCPSNISLNKIEELLKPKESLILKKVSQIKANLEKNKDLISYKKILILGEEYYINLTEKSKKVYFIDNDVFIPKKYDEAGKIKFIIKKTLLEIANKVIKNRVEEVLLKNPTYKINNLLIGSFKSKWGSCDNNKIIKLNWKLIMLPKDIIDFVIFHELTHTRELNHSRDFYKILNNFEPLHRQKRKNLKNYNYLLSLY